MPLPEPVLVRYCKKSESNIAFALFCIAKNRFTSNKNTEAAGKRNVVGRAFGTPSKASVFAGRYNFFEIAASGKIFSKARRKSHIWDTGCGILYSERGIRYFRSEQSNQ